MNNYETEEKILDKLDDLQNANQRVENFDPYAIGADEIIMNYYENKEEMSETLVDTITTLKDLGLSDKEINTLTKNILKEGAGYLSAPRKILKSYKEDCDEIKNEIGNIIMDDASKRGLTEKSVHFNGFGTVVCKLQKQPIIKDKVEFIKSLADNEELREKYLSISSRALKDKNINNFDGIDFEDKLVVTIRSDGK